MKFPNFYLSNPLLKQNEKVEHLQNLKKQIAEIL